MSSFEGYHPLLTPIFRFDWLTQFKLKNVAELTKQDLAETADWVNATMQQTMGQTALTWGIERRQTHKLIGWGGFTRLDLNTRTSQMTIQGHRLTAAEQQEIIDRLVHFGQDELQLKTMTLSQSAHVEPTVLAAAGFTTQNNDWIWQQH